MLTPLQRRSAFQIRKARAGVKAARIRVKDLVVRKSPCPRNHVALVPASFRSMIGSSGWEILAVGSDVLCVIGYNRQRYMQLVVNRTKREGHTPHNVGQR